MIRLPFAGDDDVAEAAAAACSCVARGGVVLLPTETFYGLAVDPSSAPAVERVARLKDRPATLGLPVLAADWAQVESLVEIGDRWRVRLAAAWPGATTVILPAREPLPAGAAATLAVRIPGDGRLRRLLALTGPLTATSANRHRQPPPVTLDAALASLAAEPDLALDGGPTPGGLASTLVDLTREAPRVLREGPAAWL